MFSFRIVLGLNLLQVTYFLNYLVYLFVNFYVLKKKLFIEKITLCIIERLNEYNKQTDYLKGKPSEAFHYQLLAKIRARFWHVYVSEVTVHNYIRYISDTVTRYDTSDTVIWYGEKIKCHGFLKHLLKRRYTTLQSCLDVFLLILSVMCTRYLVQM